VPEKKSVTMIILKDEDVFVISRLLIEVTNHPQYLNYLSLSSIFEVFIRLSIIPIELVYSICIKFKPNLNLLFSEYNMLSLRSNNRNFTTLVFCFILNNNLVNTVYLYSKIQKFVCDNHAFSIVSIVRLNPVL